jgi:hypothetical protein
MLMEADRGCWRLMEADGGLWRLLEADGGYSFCGTDAHE